LELQSIYNLRLLSSCMMNVFLRFCVFRVFLVCAFFTLINIPYLLSYCCRHVSVSVYACRSEPTCHRLEYREFYEDPATKCRTRVRVKHRRCQGSCGGPASGFCCLPRKIKTRRVSIQRTCCLSRVLNTMSLYVMIMHGRHAIS